MRSDYNLQHERAYCAGSTDIPRSRPTVRARDNDARGYPDILLHPCRARHIPVLMPPGMLCSPGAVFSRASGTSYLFVLIRLRAGIILTSHQTESQRRLEAVMPRERVSLTLPKLTLFFQARVEMCPHQRLMLLFHAIVIVATGTCRDQSPDPFE